MEYTYPAAFLRHRAATALGPARTGRGARHRGGSDFYDGPSTSKKYNTRSSNIAAVP
jgi:hypothetical protein